MTSDLDFKQCGGAGLLLTFLGVLGFVLSLFALLMAVIDARGTRGLRTTTIAIFVGVAASVLGAGTVAGGLAGTRRAHATVDRVVAERVAEGRVSASDGELLRQKAYDEARSCSTMGVQSGGMPLVAGLVGAIVGAVRRRRAVA